MAQMTEVKKVKNAILYHDAKGQPIIRLTRVRLSYCFVGTAAPDTDDDGKPTPKWRTKMLLPKTTHLEAKNLLKEAILSVIPEGTKVPQANWCLSDGDGDDADDEHAKGHWCVSASDSKVHPTCRTARGEIIMDEKKIDDIFQSGYWAHVLIRPWYFSGKAKNSAKSFPKRVPAGLTALVFCEVDEPFGGGRIDDSDVWGDVVNADAAGSGMDDDDDDGDL